MYTKEKQYINNNSNTNLAKTLEIVTNKVLRKKVQPFIVRAFMKEEMVEFIAYYSTYGDDIMLSPRKNMFVEFFIVRIYEDKIDYTKTTVRTEDSGMMMKYSREYGEKLQWNTVIGTDFADAEEVIELVMNIFKNNADYVYPTTSSKLKDNILKAIIVVMALAIVIFAIINMIVNWDIGELITVVIVVIMGMLIDLRKKNRFLNR